MSFADSWHWASCALLLLTLHFFMFSFYPPLSFSLSLLLSLSLSFSLSLSLYLCPLFLSVVARHMSSDALYQIFSSWSILLFHTISFHSSYKIHQLFTDYLLRLPSSELLEKHLFRSRANRRLVFAPCSPIVTKLTPNAMPRHADWPRVGVDCSALHLQGSQRLWSPESAHRRRHLETSWKCGSEWHLCGEASHQGGVGNTWIKGDKGRHRIRIPEGVFGWSCCDSEERRRRKRNRLEWMPTSWCDILSLRYYIV